MKNVSNKTEQGFNSIVSKTKKLFKKKEENNEVEIVPGGDKN